MTEAAREHDYRPRSARGFGSWQQCEHCGATFHSRRYWLAGFKSRVEPPCIDAHPAGTPWAAQAERSPLGEGSEGTGR